MSTTEQHPRPTVPPTLMTTIPMGHVVHIFLPGKIVTEPWSASPEQMKALRNGELVKGAKL